MQKKKKSPMNLKVVLCDENEREVIEVLLENGNYENLISLISESFANVNLKKVYWKDEENDWVVFGSQEEWEEACELSVKTSLPVVIRVGEPEIKLDLDININLDNHTRFRNKGNIGKKKKGKLKLKLSPNSSVPKFIFPHHHHHNRKKRNFRKFQKKEEHRNKKHKFVKNEELSRIKNNEIWKQKRSIEKKNHIHIPIPETQEIREYFFDGNNMMYMTNSLRKTKPWTKDGMKECSDGLIRGIKKFKNINSEISMNLFFDSQKKKNNDNDNDNDENVKINIFTARPDFSTADDYIVSMVSERDGDGENLVIVTSDVVLIQRLKSSKSKCWIESPLTWLSKCVKVSLGKKELEKGDCDLWVMENCLN